MASAGSFTEIQPPPTDAISSLQYCPDSPTRLLVSSWDRYLYHYDTHAAPGGQLLKRYEHRAAILNVCFGETEDVAYTVGLDWDVRRLDLRTGDQTVLSTHTEPSSQIIHDRTTQTLISASWDSTLHIHSTRSPPAYRPVKIHLPAKPFALSASPTSLIVAMSTRQVHIYTISSLSEVAYNATSSEKDSSTDATTINPEPTQIRESALKFMTRAIACMPSDAGFACSSIEGRVAVEWFDPSDDSQARKYAFKCHRVAKETVDEDGQPAMMELVYPVHCLAFHPMYGTFASGGGDGVVALWDAVAKRRIKQYLKMGPSVCGLGWSCDGKYLAVGLSPGFEDEMEEVEGNGAVDENGLQVGPVKIMIREMGESEAKPKAVK